MFIRIVHQSSHHETISSQYNLTRWYACLRTDVFTDLKRNVCICTICVRLSLSLFAVCCSDVYLMSFPDRLNFGNPTPIEFSEKGTSSLFYTFKNWRRIGCTRLLITDELIAVTTYLWGMLPISTNDFYFVCLFGCNILLRRIYGYFDLYLWGGQ